MDARARRSRPSWAATLDGRPLAGPVRKAGARWLARRHAAGQAAHDRRFRRRARDREDARGAAGKRDPLVDSLDGSRDQDEPECCQSHLAGVRAEAAPNRDVQALPLPAVHRQGQRRRRLYLNSPEAAVVLCVDEKSQIQALDRSHRCCR